jgi:putative ABC transport system permease protein
MSLWSRIWNVVRGERLHSEIDAEFESHIQEAIAHGRDPDEARRAFGPRLLMRENVLDISLIPWLESLRADAIFGWRQLKKSKITFAAAILSLALALGACTSAFRLIDAALLRPLPVANAEHLYELSRQAVFDSAPVTSDAWAYPAFQQMRASVKGQAELFAASDAAPADLTYRSDLEMEKAYVQYVSGWMFASLGIRPVLGRLLTEDDDLEPGAHPVAVISQDYWSGRFAQDSKVIGRTFRMGDRLYEIIGVAQGPFTGTQPGTMVDIFVPTMMHPGATQSDWQWHQTLALLRPGVAEEPIRAKLEAVERAFEEARLKGTTSGMPKEMTDAIINQRVLLEPASSGASKFRTETRRPLTVLGVLVALILLIACANVANLMTAQASARAREMALRLSIGGGRWRLIQMVLVQSIWLAFLATAIGAVFAWWSAPLVVRMINPPDNPARLLLPADWRVLGFELGLAFGVTVLFGLAPALRASAINPVIALRGGEDPHSRKHLMHGLIGAQVAFCFLVLFVGSLLVATFKRLSHQPTGFSADRVLVLDTVAKNPQPPAYWDQVVEHLREMRGVEAVSLTDEPLLGGTNWNNFVSVNGMPPNGVLSCMRRVSPGWLETMKIPLLDGRDFLRSDAYPGPALVNEAFAKTYFNGEDPVGRPFDMVFSGNIRQRFQAVGLVGDVRYLNLREPIVPQVYVPFFMVDAQGVPRPMDYGKVLVRTVGDTASTLAQSLREEVPRARPEFRVSQIRSQSEINQLHVVHERLLATLALFFSIVALVLAGVGLYGVLHYYVLQQQQEIGIRIALGARLGNVVRLVTADALTVVLFGTVVGFVLGTIVVHFMVSLFYQVKATDPPMVALPLLALSAVVLLAAVPAVIRAVRIDPVAMLRSE